MSDPIITDHVFSPADREFMRELAGLIIPASQEYEVPGADDEQISGEIVTLAITNHQQISLALEAAREVLVKHGVEGMESVNELVLEALQAERALAPFVSVVMQCYYRDDRVLISLGKPARAPFPRGYEVEQGDWSMLEPVQARGKIWRDA